MLLGSGQLKRAQVYPPALCKAICNGITKQRAHASQDICTIGSIEGGNWHCKLKVKKRTSWNNGFSLAFDDVNGKVLVPYMVRQARRDERLHFNDHNVYAKFPRK